VVFAKLHGSPEGAGSTPKPTVLPVGPRNEVRCELPLADNWGHHFSLSVAQVHRYEPIIESVLTLAQVDSPEPLPNSSQKRQIVVPRVEPMVTQNLVMAPLPGGVQSYVFRHPAAYAAQTSLANARAVQFSGQTVFLQYRIKEITKDGNNLASAIFQASTLDGITGVDWEAYRRWLDRSGVDVAAGEDGSAVSEAYRLVPLPGATQPASPEPTLRDELLSYSDAIFGTDRVRYPDVPGYYEYRALAYSTAGFERSEVAVSGWVAPIYDGPRPGDRNSTTVRYRQRPRAETAAFAEIKPSGDTVEIQFRLIHPRAHLPVETGKLWIEAEQSFECGATTKVPVRYGSLPDLMLNYRLYIKDPDARTDDGGQAVECLLHVAEVLAPGDQRNTMPSVGGHAWFAIRTSDQSRIVPQFGKLAGDGFYPAQLVLHETASTGEPSAIELRLSVTLKFTADEWITRLRKIQDALKQNPTQTMEADFIRIGTSRTGVNSLIMPRP